MDPNWLMTGGIMAAAGIAATCWRQLLSLYQQSSKALFVTVQITPTVMSAIYAYLRQKQARSRWSDRRYASLSCHLYSIAGRLVSVPAEVLDQGSNLFWLGHWPLIVKDTSRQDGGAGNAPASVGSMAPAAVASISVIRGTVDIEQLLIDAMRLWDHETAGRRNRFSVYQCIGTAGQAFMPNGGPSNISESRNPELADARSLLLHRLLGVDPADLNMSGKPRSLREGDGYMMNEATQALYEEIKHWADSPLWYAQRLLPWRKGVNCVGDPGTGKTSFARTVAESLGLPVFVMNLSTMRNSELVTHWTDAARSAPCIILIEDIDAVFKGREALQGELSFDRLLNCIDGVATNDGVLLFVTANSLEHVDHALGGLSGRSEAETNSDMPSRPGRIDHVLEFGAMHRHCRLALAERILQDCQDMIPGTVLLGENDTGAQFQERCRCVAYEFYREAQEDKPWQNKQTNSSRRESPVEI